MSTHSSSRPHWAGRWENRFDAALAALLRRRGWRPRIEPYTGYGLAPLTGGTATTAETARTEHESGEPQSVDGWVRVLGRVMLAPSRPDDDPDPSALPEESAPVPRARRARSTTEPEELRAVRGWRSFLTAQLPGAHVEVTVGSRVHTVVADRGGYIDARLPADLAEGWHEVRIAPDDGPSVAAPVRVIASEPHTGLVSDVDDTVMVTSLPRPLTAVWNILVLHEDARRPVRGMSQLYADLGGLDPEMPVVYLSTNAWNVAAALRRFFAYHRFPAGPLLLTDWGPTNTGWFRGGPQHKRRALERLAAEFPHVRWILVGDDGQHDPQIYRGFARAYPGAVRAVVIRELSAGQQVLAHGAPTPTTGSRGAGEVVEGTDVPEVRGPDGQTLAVGLRAAGVLAAVPGRG